MKAIFAINKGKDKIFIPPKAYNTILKGPKWYGTNGCIADTSLVDDRMKSADYGDDLEEKVDADGTLVDRVLDRAFEDRLVAYSKKKEIRVNNVELMQWVKLSVYKGPKEIIFVDSSLCPPDKIYGASEGAIVLLDNRERDKVKMIIGPYHAGEEKYREIASTM